MNAVAFDLTPFVGVPYKPRGRSRAGYDCWGVCLAFAEEALDLKLPEYFYDEARILEHACEHIGREVNLPRWQAVLAQHRRPGDILIFRIMGFETHCGIYIGAGQFLHSLAGRNSCVEMLSDANWAHRLTGAYRWTTI